MNKYSLDTPLVRVEITKFNGTNYQRWSNQVRAGLKAIEAWQLIEEDLDGEESSENERRRYRTLNDKGFSLIYNSVDETQQVFLDSTKDSCRTAWNLLKILYGQTEETLERRNLERDSEKEIEKWREGRILTNMVMKELVDKLKALDDVVNNFVVGGTGMQVAGNAMIVTGVVLEVFCPQSKGLAAFLKNWGKGVDLVGVTGVSLVKLTELGLSRRFLNKVDATLKADIENTEEMIRKIFELEDVTFEMLQDLTISISAFFRRRYGKQKTGKSKATSESARVPLWKELSHAIGVPLFEWQGDSALNLVGVGEALRPACVHGALLAWNIYYLMSTRGFKSQAQYVTFAEAALKTLEEELESSRPRDKKD